MTNTAAPAAPARDYAERYLAARRAVHAPEASFVQRLAAVNAAQDVDDAARADGVLLYLPALDQQAAPRCSSRPTPGPCSLPRARARPICAGPAPARCARPAVRPSLSELRVSPTAPCTSLATVSPHRPPSLSPAGGRHENGHTR